MPHSRSIVTAIMLMLFFSTALISQKINLSQNDSYRVRKYNAKSETVASLMEKIRTDFRLETGDLKSVQRRTSMNGIIHEKYHQFHDDLLVYGSKYILHSKEGKMLTSNGYLASEIAINTTPNLQPLEAEKIAYSHSQNEQYNTERIQETELIIIDKAFPSVSQDYALAYKVEVYTEVPLSKTIYFIDAHTGVNLLELPGLIHNATPAIAHTKYHGEQEIITESQEDGSFLLQDLTRGEGITTYNHDFTPFHNSSTQWDLTNIDQDEVALDAHYATEKFYDMMLQRFSWDGLDGGGKSMNPVVHIGDGQSIVNAYWDGHYAYFGDGDCHRGPLTTLEVVGHEFMHGITDYTSDLIYSFESGAINESMSDIFGKALEYYYAPEEFDWKIGESFLLTDLIEPFRYMDDPSKKNMPAYYKGNNWYDGGGVHKHSAIGNLWFHLLVEGGSDTTELGYQYEVNGIGMDKAIEIVWQVQSNYLTPTAEYTDMYESSVSVATAMFGEESPELADVIEAWKAVGLPQLGEGSSSLSYDLGVLIDYIPQRQCLRNEFLPFTVRIVNFGTEDIPDSAGVILNVDHVNVASTTSFEIYNSIPSGESLAMTFDSIAYLVEPGYVSLSAYTLFELDENLLNNNYNLRPYRIDNYDPIYNSLEYEFLDVQRSCFDDTIHFDIYIENLSCYTLDIGTDIIYTIADITGDTILQGSHILDKPLPSGERFSLADLVVGTYNTLILDVYTANNSAIDRIPDRYDFENQSKIEGTYFNDLSDVDKNINELEIYRIENIVEYNGLQYFAKGGGTVEEFFYPCPEDIQDFNPVNGYHNGYSRIAACVDLSEIENPVLSFDLVQFRDDSDTIPELESLRARAKISWGTDPNDFVIIDDQQEGVEVHHTINLPQHFKGTFSIEFVNLTGKYLGSDVEAYLEYDVNMIRNLEIKNSTHTADQTWIESIVLYPNPGNGMYYIDSPEPIQYISVMDVNGRSILSKSAIAKQRIDLSYLEAGYYIVSFHLDDGSQISRPIVHIKP